VKLLADTSALLALVLRDDACHEAAAAFARGSPKARYVVTEMIIGEVATRLRARSTAERAVGVVRELLRSRRYELLLIDADLLRGALTQMAHFQDKRLSLTDCASFEVMQRLGLEAAFSFDHDFRDCGFRMVP
jgi:predicted nucleic acid-binding protein